MKDVFYLPVQIVVQRCVYRDVQERQMSHEVTEQLARSALMETLKLQTDGGEICTTDFAAASREHVLTMTVRAECLEEIGEEVPLGAEELRQIQIENTSGDETTND